MHQQWDKKAVVKKRGAGEGGEGEGAAASKKPRLLEPALGESSNSSNTAGVGRPASYSVPAYPGHSSGAGVSPPPYPGTSPAPSQPASPSRFSNQQ